MTPAPTLVSINRVRPGQADAFERWLQEVVLPASRDAGMDEERFLLLRAADADVFVFAFFGGGLEEWDLEALLERACGRERAEREMATVLDLLTEDQESWSVADIRR